MMQAWWKESIVYQIYPRSFCDANGDGIGDLEGITGKLDYLQELGVDVIWLSPIYQSPNFDNGYDISDYQAIMEEFGTMADFDRLLEEAHRRNLKIMLDLVVNHTSHLHPWFVESRKGKDSPYRDYYIWRSGKDSAPPNNWESFFSGPAWDYDEASGMYYLHLFASQQPDLNWENPKVRGEVYDMMTWWLDKGVDGFRMDVINLISKAQGLPDGEPIPGTPYGDRTPYTANGPRVHEYLQEMNRQVLSKYDIITVGETPDTPVEEALKYTGSDRGELNMIFQFEHMSVDHRDGVRYCSDRFDLLELKRTLSNWQTGLHGIGWNSLYWNNHDQPRAVSRFGDDSLYWEESAKMLGTCLHMMQGTPYIYQGEEIGMVNAAFERIEDYDDIESVNTYWEYVNNRGADPGEMLRIVQMKGRDNARTPMQWDDSEHAGFTTGTPWLRVNPSYRRINVKSQLQDEASIFHHYKQLIRLRKENPIIVYGDYRLLEAENTELFAYLRGLEGQMLLVVCNFTGNDAAFTVPKEFALEGARLLIANYHNCVAEREMLLRPYEARAYLAEPL